MHFVFTLCTLLTLNGKPVGCASNNDLLRYYPVERELRIGALRVGPGTQPWPGLEHFPMVELRLTGREVPIFANGLE